MTKLGINFTFMCYCCWRIIGCVWTIILLCCCFIIKTKSILKWLY